MIRFTTVIDSCLVESLHSGVLRVIPLDGDIISVLPTGTHAALDVLGEDTKRKIVYWWKTIASH